MMVGRTGRQVPHFQIGQFHFAGETRRTMESGAGVNARNISVVEATSEVDDRRSNHINLFCF